MARYKHIFVCPQCDELASFVDSEKVTKDTTLETGCSCGGITRHAYHSTKVLEK